MITVIKPIQWQRQVLDNPAKVKVISAGRRSGKTTLALAELIYEALVNGTEVWYVSPSYKQSKQIAWKMLIDKLEELGVPYKRKEQELSVICNGIIRLKGADDPDSLRGNKLAGMVIDEAAYIDDLDYVYNNVLKPSLLDLNGWTIFISSPNGFDDFYDLYNKNAHFHAKTSDNPYMTQKAIDELKVGMTDIQAKQELDAEFLPQGNYQYFQRVDNIIVDKGLTVEEGAYYLIGCDLGRYHDSTVLTAINTNNNVLEGYESFEDTEWNIQKYRIANFARKYNDGLVVIDATNNSSVAEDLEIEGISIEPIHFTAKNKIEMYEKLRIYIEQRQLYIPNIEKMKFELNKFQFRLEGGLKLATQSEHDDCVSSLALAVKNLDKLESVHNIQLVKQHKSTSNIYQRA